MTGDALSFLSMLERDPASAWASFLEGYATTLFGIVRLYERDPDDASDCFLFVCEKLADRGLRRLRKFDPDGRASFTTWLAAVVRNLCIDWKRKKSGRFRLFRSVESLPPLEQEVFRCVYEEGMGAEEAFLRLRPRFPDLSRHQIADCVDRLSDVVSPRQRALLGRRRIHETLLHEIRDERADPESSALQGEIRDRARRAVQRLDPLERLLIELRYERDLTLAQIARMVELRTPQSVDRRLRSILERLRDEIERKT